MPWRGDCTPSKRLSGITIPELPPMAPLVLRCDACAPRDEGLDERLDPPESGAGVDWRDRKMGKICPILALLSRM